MNFEIIYEATRSFEISPLLRQVHCLPIEKRIQENILTLTFKARNDFLLRLCI